MIVTAMMLLTASMTIAVVTVVMLALSIATVDLMASIAVISSFLAVALQPIAMIISVVPRQGWDDFVWSWEAAGDSGVVDVAPTFW